VSTRTQPSTLALITGQIHKLLVETKRHFKEVKEIYESDNATTICLLEANKRYVLLEKRMEIIQEQLTMVLKQQTRDS